MAKKKYYLTTTDNKFNYFTDYDNWLDYDTAHGYNTNCLVASVAIFNEEMPDAINEDLQDIAIDEIISWGLAFTNDEGKEVFYKRCYEP